VYGAGTLLAEGTSTSGGPSSTPGSGRGAALNADPSGGGGLALLGVAHATLAATAIVVPAAVANTFFPGSALPQGVATQALVQLLGCGLATGSATCFALKQAADDNDLKSPLAQRLQLGLMGFSLGAIALHVLYSPGITPVSMVSGAAVMGTPFGVPYQTYRKAVGSIGPGEVLKRYIGAVPDHLR